MKIIIDGVLWFRTTATAKWNLYRFIDEMFSAKNYSGKGLHLSFFSK